MANIAGGLNTNLNKLTRVGRADNVAQVASADRINAIQNLLRLLVRGDNIVAGPNIRKRSGDGFVMLTGAAGGKGRGGVADLFPWKISIKLTDIYEVHVGPGTVNGALPSNIFDNFDISPTGTYYVQLDMVSDGVKVTDVSLDVVTSPPPPIPWQLNFAPYLFHYLIAVIVNRTVFQVLYDNIYAYPIAGVQTLAAAPEPGRPLYDTNWSWLIEAV